MPWFSKCLGHFDLGSWNAARKYVIEYKIRKTLRYNTFILTYGIVKQSNFITFFFPKSGWDLLISVTSYLLKKKQICIRPNKGYWLLKTKVSHTDQLTSYSFVFWNLAYKHSCFPLNRQYSIDNDRGRLLIQNVIGHVALI